MKKPAATLGLVAALLAIGAADAFLTDIRLPQAGQESPGTAQAPITTNTAQDEKQGKTILETLSDGQFSFTETREESLLDMIIENGTSVQTRTLIKDGDRVGFMAWAESPKVKLYFISLKEALHGSFTPKVKDLIDETQKTENGQLRNLLTFYDPGISPERLVFLRIQNKILEFHIAQGKDDLIFGLIDKLSY